jgi:hypothetical protein
MDPYLEGSEWSSVHVALSAEVARQLAPTVMPSRVPHVSEVWPIQLNMRLPIIPVPLLAEDPDVTLDVQLALATVYDAFTYDLSLDYTRPAEIPLVGPAAVWAAEQLRQAGIGRRTE